MQALVWVFRGLLGFKALGSLGFIEGLGFRVFRVYRRLMVEVGAVNSRGTWKQSQGQPKTEGKETFFTNRGLGFRV